MIHLVLGGARSGKSRFALEQATILSQQSDLPVTFVATATPLDPEMAQRIVHHQAERPATWGLAEVPLNLSVWLTETQSQPKKVLIIDCLTLWLNNHLFEFPEQDFDTLFRKLVDALKASPCDIFLVSNQVGLGVIPMGELTRKFVDQTGWLNQLLAKHVDKVTLVTAGLPMTLKE
jgi:adenosylcobinamide kinase/adenosylcobinamide-phosphate guanylyltransferase